MTRDLLAISAPSRPQHSLSHALLLQTLGELCLNLFFIQTGYLFLVICLRFGSLIVDILWAFMIICKTYLERRFRVVIILPFDII